ncbi:hypothetical protein HY523_00025 [Candidatus Berkelbacteria bacterium]|nr:hypothetical protein [Candidatus Berkelbacteria bacterium]
MEIGNWKLEIGRTGNAFLFVLIWYSLARGLTELWRISDRLIGPPAPTRECFTAVYSSGFHFGQWCGAGLSLAQLISLGLVVAVSLVLLARYRLDKKSPQS